MGDFISRASSSTSYYRQESTNNPLLKSRTELDKEVIHRETNLYPVREASSLVASEDMVNDMKAQQQMMAEKTAMIKQLQAKNRQINDIIRDMGEMVGGEQRDMVNVIGQNLEDAHYNVGQANNQLDDALEYQKKSKRKYIIAVTVIIILLILTGGVIYFVVS